MAKIFLITHPDVIIDPNTAIDNWQLSAKGLKRINNLLNEDFWNEVSTIYSSTELKAKTVAEIITKRYKLPLILAPELKEIDRSSTGFIPYEKFMQTVTEFFNQPDKSILGWETANQATQRISQFVERIIKINQNKNIAFIGHGAIFALLLSYLKGVAPTLDLCQDGVGFIATIDWDKKNILSIWKKY